jgi:hypothetical protein
MFFRIWFLYLCKLFPVGLVLVLVGLATGATWEFAPTLKTIGGAIIVPLGIGGALTALLILFRKQLACPLCGQRGDLVVYGTSPGVECVHCGLVYCKSPLLSFRLSVVPPETADPNNAS